MPIRKRVETKPATKDLIGPGPAEPAQVHHTDMLSYIRHAKASGTTNLWITVPLAPPKYGMIPVSIDQLLSLAEAAWGDKKPSAPAPRKLKLKR